MKFAGEWVLKVVGETFIGKTWWRSKLVRFHCDKHGLGDCRLCLRYSSQRSIRDILHCLVFKRDGQGKHFFLANSANSWSHGIDVLFCCAKWRNILEILFWNKQFLYWSTFYIICERECIYKEIHWVCSLIFFIFKDWIILNQHKIN